MPYKGCATDHTLFAHGLTENHKDTKDTKSDEINLALSRASFVLFVPLW